MPLFNSLLGQLDVVQRDGGLALSAKCQVLHHRPSGRGKIRLAVDVDFHGSWHDEEEMELLGVIESSIRYADLWQQLPLEPLLMERNACCSLPSFYITLHDTAHTMPPSTHGSIAADIGTVQLTLVFSISPQKRSSRETQPTTTVPSAEHKDMLDCEYSTDHVTATESKAITSEAMLLQDNSSSHAQTEPGDDHAGISRPSRASLPSTAVFLLDLAFRSFIRGRPIRSPTARLIGGSSLENGLASLAPAAFSPGHAQAMENRIRLVPTIATAFRAIDQRCVSERLREVFGNFARKRNGEDPRSECVSLEQALARMATTHFPDPSVAAKKLKPMVYRQAPTVPAASASVEPNITKEEAVDVEVLFDEAEVTAAACTDAEVLFSDEKEDNFEDSGILLDEEDEAAIPFKEDTDLNLLTDDFAPEEDALYARVLDLLDWESPGLDGSMLEGDAVEDTLDTTLLDGDAVDDGLDASLFPEDVDGLPSNFNESLFGSGLGLDASNDADEFPDMLEPEPASPIDERLEQLLDEDMGEEFEDDLEMEDLLF